MRFFVSEILTFIFNMGRVLLQPAKKVRILTKFRSFCKTLIQYFCTSFSLTQPISLSYNINAQIDIDPTKTKSSCHQNCFTGSRDTWTRVWHVYQSFLPQTLVIRLPTFKHWVHVAKIHRKTFLWQPISRCKIIYNQNWDKLLYSRIYTNWIQFSILCYTYFRFQIYS